MIDAEFIVICCGGGGIPVIREGRTFAGVDAVIDKDLASAKLAYEVGADIFVIATDVTGAAINYGNENEHFFDSLSIEDASRYLSEGHFPAGSMGPKIEAAIQFAAECKKRAVICSVMQIIDAVNGKAGTEIVL